MTGKRARSYLVGLLGIFGFSILMAIRDEARHTSTRVLLAALAGFVITAAFYHVQRTLAPR